MVNRKDRRDGEDHSSPRISRMARILVAVDGGMIAARFAG